MSRGLEQARADHNGRHKRTYLIDLFDAVASTITPTAPDWELALLEGDAVNHPPHYTSHPSGIECIEITRHMGFNLGNALKYIWRADEKGNALEDLEKAIWYLQDELTKRAEQ